MSAKEYYEPKGENEICTIIVASVLDFSDAWHVPNIFWIVLFGKCSGMESLVYSYPEDPLIQLNSFLSLMVFGNKSEWDCEINVSLRSW